MASANEDMLWSLRLEALIQVQFWQFSKSVHMSDLHFTLNREENGAAGRRVLSLAQRGGCDHAERSAENSHKETVHEHQGQHFALLHCFEVPRLLQVSHCPEYL